jgi:hypothetical protein
MDAGKVSSSVGFFLIRWQLIWKQIVELDTPQTLLANKASIFWSLAHEAGLAYMAVE